MVVAIGLTIVLGSLLARWLKIPQPVVLVLAGCCLALIPALDGTGLPPELVLMLFLPALLYWESLTTSLREVRRFIRGVLLTGVVLVIITALSIALVLNWMGVDWSVALLIGAALAPTDATAVAAFGRGLGRRPRVVLEAESLINDGTALVLYALALGLVTGTADTGALPIAGQFGISFGGGLVIGVAIGLLFWQARRRIPDPVLANAAAIVAPFLAYLLAEQVGASGVLAVVACGLLTARFAPTFVTAEARQQGAGFWAMTTFLLNGALFVLVGLQLPSTVAGLSTDTVGHAILLVIAAYATMMLTRFVFLVSSAYIIRLVDRRPYQRTLRVTNKARLISTVAGFRGGISLAMALAVPATVAAGGFASRDLVIFVTGLVVVLTLVIQGFALPRVIRWADLPQDRSEAEEIHLAQDVACQKVLDELPEMARERGISDDITQVIVEEFRRVQENLRALDGSLEPSAPGAQVQAQQLISLRLAAIDLERSAVVKLRDDGVIDDPVLQTLQARFDADELRFQAAQSD